MHLYVGIEDANLMDMFISKLDLQKVRMCVFCVCVCVRVCVCVTEHMDTGGATVTSNNKIQHFLAFHYEVHSTPWRVCIHQY